MCNHKMAEEMGPLIARAGGEIREKDVRSYGVVIFVQKKVSVGKTASAACSPKLL